MTAALDAKPAFSPVDDYRRSMEEREKQVNAGLKKIKRSWESYQPAKDPDAKVLSPGKFLATGDTQNSEIYLGPHFKRLKGCREQNVTASDATLLDVFEAGFTSILREVRSKYRKDKCKLSRHCYRAMLAHPEMKKVQLDALRDHLSVRMGVFRNQCHLLKDAGRDEVKFFVERTQYQVGAGRTLPQKIAKGFKGDWKVRTEGAHPAIIRQLCDNRRILENKAKYLGLIREIDPREANQFFNFADSGIENLLSVLEKDGVGIKYIRLLRTFIYKESPRSFKSHIEELANHCSPDASSDKFRGDFIKRLTFYIEKHTEYTFLRATDETKQDWVYRSKLDELDRGMMAFLVENDICNEDDAALQEQILGAAIAGSAEEAGAELENFDVERFYTSVIEHLCTEVPTVHDTFPAGSIMLQDMAQTRVVLPYINHKIDDPFDKCDKEAIRLLNLVAKGELDPDEATIALKDYSLAKVDNAVARLLKSQEILQKATAVLKESKKFIHEMRDFNSFGDFTTGELYVAVCEILDFLDRDESGCLMEILAERTVGSRDPKQGEIHFSPFTVEQIRSFDPDLTFLNEGESFDDETIRIRFYEEFTKDPKGLMQWFFDTIQYDDVAARQHNLQFIERVIRMADGLIPLRREDAETYEIEASLEAFKVVKEEMNFDEVDLERQGPVNPAIAEVFASVIAKDCDGMEIGRYF